MKNVLALSSSRVAGGGYLEAALPVIKKFLGEAPRRIAFIPFASVDSYEEYGKKVADGLSALPHNIETVDSTHAKDAINRSDLIMIGGGNTFKLLHDLYQADLMNLIKSKVEAGMPYIGWSAGSNLCGPTICTTNDMPIIQPKSFAAFGFFPFQINPHYRNEISKDFHGETRDQRLEEFLKLNQGKEIYALPEGTYLKWQNNELVFDGAAQGIRITREDGLTIQYIIHPGTAVALRSE